MGRAHSRPYQRVWQGNNKLTFVTLEEKDQKIKIYSNSIIMAKGKKGVRKGKRQLPATVAKNARAIRQIRRSYDKKLREAQHTLSPDIDGSLGGPLLLSSIAVGDNELTRDGNKISHIGTFLKGHVHRGVAATKPHSRIRLMVVRQKNNQTPAFAGVLQTATLDSFYSDSFSTLAEVMFDKTYLLSVNTPEKAVKIAIMKKFDIKFSGVNGTDLGANTVWLMAIGDQSVAIERPTMDLQLRMRYTDS